MQTERKRRSAYQVWATMSPSDKVIAGVFVASGVLVGNVAVFLGVGVGLPIVFWFPGLDPDAGTKAYLAIVGWITLILAGLVFFFGRYLVSTLKNQSVPDTGEATNNQVAEEGVRLPTPYDHFDPGDQGAEYIYLVELGLRAWASVHSTAGFPSTDQSTWVQEIRVLQPTSDTESGGMRGRVILTAVPSSHEVPVLCGVELTLAKDAEELTDWQVVRAYLTRGRDLLAEYLFDGASAVRLKGRFPYEFRSEHSDVTEPPQLPWLRNGSDGEVGFRHPPLRTVQVEDTGSSDTDRGGTSVTRVDEWVERPPRLPQ